MGIYLPLWDQPGHELPPIEQHPFCSPDDVLHWAQRDQLVSWKTWPEVWHLDESGHFHCYFKASSLDSIRGWADDPDDLHRSYWAGQEAPDGCVPNWLIIEPRPRWNEVITPTEDDAKAFVELRRELATLDVNLVDAVIFDEEHHWWSMYALEHPGAPYQLIANGESLPF